VQGRLAIAPDQVVEFCVRHGVRRLSLFGSVLRGEERDDSDIDLLIEFRSGVGVGLLGLAGMELELSDMLARNVDLRTPAELSPYFRDTVLATVEVLYAA
jgi:hypothetical protein